MTGQEIIEKKALGEIHVGGLSLNFQRTCRVPEGQINSLPAGLGSFSLYKVDDFKSGVPKDWSGYFMPMYIQEAMWINFQRHYNREPHAVIIGAGSINAVTGKQMKKKGKEFEMSLEEQQNYLVVPPQPWIDGWKDKDGKIYQFVAAYMGSGETIEGQITGEEKFGGIQLGIFQPKPGQNLVKATRPREHIIGGSWSPYLGGIELCDSLGMPEEIAECVAEFGGYLKSMAFVSSSLASASYESKGFAKPLRSSGRAREAVRSIQAMGLGRGGEIEQKIYPDTYGLKVWQENPIERTYIHMVDDESFRQITGCRAPPTPVTYEKYQQFGLPWFELYDKKLKDTSGTDIFSKLKTVTGKKGKKTKI